VGRLLVTNRALRSLNISRNQLVGLKVDKGQSVGNMSLVGIESLASALKTNSTLTSLNISQNYLGGTPTAEAASTFCGVVTLLADALLLNRSLIYLNVSANNFCVPDAVFLKEVIDGPDYSGPITTLYGLADQLQEANLQRKGLLSADMINIGYELRHQPVLTAVDLSGNIFLGSNGIKRLYESLSQISFKHPLTKLVLKKICNDKCDEIFCKSIANIVNLSRKGFICIDYLDLSENVGLFGDEDGQHLFFHLTFAINESPTLKNLKLVCCGINTNSSRCVNFTNVLYFSF